jgi:hypothetical protein
VAFAEFDNADGEDLIICYFWEVFEVGTTTLPTTTQNPTCPLGTVTISLTPPPATNAVTDGGVGPCGVGIGL